MEELQLNTSPDFTNITHEVRSLVNLVDSGGIGESHLEALYHSIAEQVLEAYYGKEVHNWINEKMKW